MTPEDTQFKASSPSLTHFHLRRCERERHDLSGEVIGANLRGEVGHAVATPFVAVGFRCSFLSSPHNPQARVAGADLRVPNPHGGELLKRV